MYDIDRNARQAQGQCELVPNTRYDYVCDIVSASFLFWGEHCVECTEPSCYVTCDLYVSRPDGRCRRFTQGIVRNPQFPSARGYGAEVSFRKWGKLEARGNSALMAHRWLMLVERVLGGSRPLLDLLSAAVWRVSGNARWRSITLRTIDRAVQKAHARRRHSRPDAFLLELYNPAETNAVLQIVLSVARKALTVRGLNPMALLPSFGRRLELPPGYSRHAIPYAQLAPVAESGLPFNIALIPEADSNPTLIFLRADFVRFARDRRDAAEQRGNLLAIKCVVLDLDNTVWRGTLLEDEHVEPDSRVLELVKILDQRGILLSVASKNDFALANKKMKEIGIEEYALYPQIGWFPKSEGLKIIAKNLNIGLDTFMLIDDSQFELDEVSRALPMVTCVNTKEIATLLENPRLRGSETFEAKRRRLMYREAIAREDEERKFGDDFFEFLKSCNIKINLFPYNENFFDRVCELLQRTNQLNFSGRKYRREEIVPILAEPGLEKWVIECSDRFGSYGVVGFGLVSRRPAEVWIEDFMLSCRVQGRFVERALFHALVASDPSVSRIGVNFTSTRGNTPARQVLLAMGFEEVDSENYMYLDLRRHDVTCDFIELKGGPSIVHRQAWASA